MHYVLDHLAFTPDVRSKLYDVYVDKMEALIRSGKFSNEIPAEVEPADRLFVGVFGNPFSLAIPSRDRKISIDIILRFLPKNIYVVLEDMHNHTFTNIKSLMEFLSNKNTILTYWNTPESIQFRSNGVCKWIPHHVKLYGYSNVERSNEVLVYGAIDKDHYPERSLLIENLRSKGFPIRVIRNPTYTPRAGSYVREGLAKLISQYKYVLVTPSQYEYCVAKYFEASAAGASLVGMPCKDSELLGFKVDEYPAGDNSAHNFEVVQRFNLENYVNDMYAA